MDSCNHHGSNECKSCNSGYSLSKVGGSCNANICTCRNGTPASPGGCSYNRGVKCVGCDDGYELRGDACQASSAKGRSRNRNKSRSKSDFSASIARRMWSKETCAFLKTSCSSTDVSA